jgi:hypothetical protein
MALNWSGQQTGYSSGPNLSNLYQQNQQPQGMTTGTWRPSTTGATGISGIGGSQIGLSRPQMSPAPPMYPQMSNAYPTSKGGAPQYNRDVQQQEQDWLNQNQYPQMHNANPNSGNTTTNGITYNAQGQQLDSHGNVAYGDWGSNNNGGGGGGQPGQYNTSMNGPTSGQGVGLTPGAGGHQGAQQDYLDPVTGQMIYGNQQATGWHAPFPGMNSGEGGTSGVGGGGGFGPPFTQAQYMAMKPEQQAAANNWMATQMPYMQFGQNAYQYDRDSNQAAAQWAAQFGHQMTQDQWNQQFAQQQLGYGRQDAATAQGNWMAQFGAEQRLNDRQMTLAERQAIQAQQQWGAGHVLAQNQQQYDQGMGNRQFAEGQRQFDTGQGNWQSQFGEGQRQFNQQYALQQRGQEQQYGLDAGRLQSDTQRWQGDQGIARQGQLNELDMFGRRMGEDQRQFNSTFGEGQRQFNVGQGNVDRQFGEDTRRYNQGFGEDTRRYNQDFGEDARRYNQDFGFKQSQFGEDTRRFDVGQGNWQSEFGEDARRYNQDFGFKQTQFGEDTRRFDAGQAQQMQIENMRLAQAERAANVAATGRALAPNARWLRAA